MRRAARTSYLLSPRALIAAVCAAVAIGISALTVGLAIHPGGSTSTLVHMSASDPIFAEARRADPNFAFVPITSHYDGTYFYAVARDPFARGQEHQLIDRAAYRYGHPFYGQLAGLLSWGRPGSVPGCLLAVSLIAMGIAGAAASLLASGWGWSPWSGLVVALSPGLIYAVTADTAEPLVAALLGLALLAWRSRRVALAGVAFVLLALTKEPMSLVPVGVFLFEAVRVWRRDRTFVPAGWSDVRWRRRSAGALAALAAGPLVLLGWLIYVDRVFGRWPLSDSSDLIGTPFDGIHRTADQAARLVRSDFAYAQIGAAALPVVVVAFAALAVGIVAALRLRTLADAVFLATAPLMFLLGPADLLYPKDLLRITVVPVLLLAAVLRGVRPERAPVTPAAEGAASL
jgi:hypothetical protein